MARTATEVAPATQAPTAPAAELPATLEKVSAGHLVAKALIKAEGVDTIFTLCGGHIIDIYDGCVDEGIRVVDVRHEQVATRGRIDNTLGDVHYDQFATMLGGYGEEVRDPKDIGPAMRRARESGKPSLSYVWVDPDAYTPGTMNQTMYK